MSAAMANPSLAGKQAVVVGGSGGIGAATARLFAEAGARVTITYRSDVRGAAEIIAALPGTGHAALPAVIEDASSIAALKQALAARSDRIDILVNTAGFTKAVPHADLDALDDDLIDRLFAVNWRGQFAVIRALRPLLAGSGDALIVNVSSISGQSGLGSNIAYCAAKAGIDVMTKSLARVLAPSIRVMAVSPGVVDTDFVPGRDAAANAKIAATLPLRRVATPEDVAAAIMACATHLRHATGSIITIDGGRML
jgi:3-oxoacyl-[acyl-carrier protein] reductase